ncbi:MULTISPECIES: hypothetical protein [unclassified Veillonella]|uniref:hypothetical protein n=1 Tax=unclassified Veillonella TaxID=2630086 RepID=UPI001FF34E01|nr:MULTISPECIES: hypothetical protein [unclassified Veillonella]MCK0528882.1 hypothetical protein [Veillonella sp. KGMB01456]
MSKELAKTGLYILGTFAGMYGLNAVEYLPDSAAHMIAGLATCAASVMVAERIEVPAGEPVDVIIEVPQPHAYNWAKQGRPGEVR